LEGAKKVAKALTKEPPPVAPVLEGVVKEVVGGKTEVDMNSEELHCLKRKREFIVPRRD